MGDVIHTLPLACALKRNFPEVFIGWVVEDRAADLLVGNPCIDKLYVLPKKKWKEQKFNFLENISEFSSIIREIREDNYDVAIDVQGLLKSAVVNFLSGAQRRLSHQKTREFAFLLANEHLQTGGEFECGEHIIERNLKFAQYLGCEDLSVAYSLPQDADASEYAEFLLSDLSKDKPLVVFSPATTWNNKHWPVEYWAELLKRTAYLNNIVFTGMSADLPMIEEIIRLSGNKPCKILAGKTDILTLLEIFKQSDVVVSPDSGSAHLACAAEKPSVICLVGPTSEVRNGPYGSKHYSIVSSIPCRPCFKKKCEGNIDCMREINVEDVINYINKVLTNN